jgi:hypothetical protein
VTLAGLAALELDEARQVEPSASFDRALTESATDPGRHETGCFAP